MSCHTRLVIIAAIAWSLAGASAAKAGTDYFTATTAVGALSSANGTEFASYDWEYLDLNASGSGYPSGSTGVSFSTSDFAFNPGFYYLPATQASTATVSLGDSIQVDDYYTFSVSASTTIGIRAAILGGNVSLSGNGSTAYGTATETPPTTTDLCPTFRITRSPRICCRV